MSSPIIPAVHDRLLVWLATAPVKELRDVAVDDDAPYSHTRLTRRDLAVRITHALTRKPGSGWWTPMHDHILGQLVERGLLAPEAVR